MYSYRFSEVDQWRDKFGQLFVSKHLYGSRAVDEFLLRDCESLPLYAHLARKAQMHYARDHYNPHGISIAQEVHVRTIIKQFVSHKVMNRLKSYDWNYIDHFLRWVIEDYYKLEPTYDMAFIEAGPSEQFRVPFVSNDQTPS